MGCGDDVHVNVVNDSKLAKYSDSKTIGDAFDDWKSCEDITWKSGNNEYDERIVQYGCKLDEYREKAESLFTKRELSNFIYEYIPLISHSILVQFTFNADNDWEDGKKRTKAVNYFGLDIIRMIYANEHMFYSEDRLGKRSAQKWLKKIER